MWVLVAVVIVICLLVFLPSGKKEVHFRNTNSIVEISKLETGKYKLRNSANRFVGARNYQKNIVSLPDINEGFENYNRGKIQTINKYDRKVEL